MFITWSTKAAISLKRVKRDEKLLWRAYRKSKTLFRTVPSPIPYGVPFPRIGVRNPPQNCNRYIISGTGKATDYIRRVHPKNPLKIWGKRERWRIHGTGQFFLSQEPVQLQTSNLAAHRVHSHKALKNFGEKGAWAYQETSQIF